VSQESFAVVSVATAVICGVFFYPPAPQSRTQPAPVTSAATTASVARVAATPAAISLQAPVQATRIQATRIQATMHRARVMDAPRPMAPAATEHKGNAT